MSRFGGSPEIQRDGQQMAMKRWPNSMLNARSISSRAISMRTNSPWQRWRSCRKPRASIASSPERRPKVLGEPMLFEPDNNVLNGLKHITGKSKTIPKRFKIKTS